MPTVVIKCAAGLERVVAKAASADCTGLAVTQVDPGLLRVTVDRHSANRVADLPYATWTGIGIESITGNESADPAMAVRQIDGREISGELSLSRRSSFRFRFLDETRLVAVDRDALTAAARAVERRAPLLRYDPRDPGIEIWVIRRRGSGHFEGFARRVEKRRSTRGALDDDVAAALVRVFDPAPDDVFLDPFAGHGTIPAARSRYPAAWVGACDISPPGAQVFSVGRADTFSEESLERYLRGRRPNAIVTDLPWGHYDPTVDVAELYKRLPARIAEIGQRPVRCALLVARDPELVDTLTSGMALTETPFPVLIHGRKATMAAGRIG